jgi:DNA replication protein DnaC
MNVTLSQLMQQPRRDVVCTTCGTTFRSIFASECEPCGQKAKEQLRRETISSQVGAARRSIPDWPWARFSDPKFIERTANAAAMVTAGKAWTPKAGNLILSGPTGLGKTVTAVAIANAIYDQAFDADPKNWIDQKKVVLARRTWFVTGHQLVESRRSTPLGRGIPELVGHAYDAAVLILDEVGYEPRDEVVFSVIDERYRDGAPTIVTSGLDMAGLRARYGDAAIRRLTDLGEFVKP